MNEKKRNVSRALSNGVRIVFADFALLLVCHILWGWMIYVFEGLLSQVLGYLLVYGFIIFYYKDIKKEETGVEIFLHCLFLMWVFNNIIILGNGSSVPQDSLNKTLYQIGNVFSLNFGTFLNKGRAWRLVTAFYILFSLLFSLLMMGTKKKKILVWIGVGLIGILLIPYFSYKGYVAEGYDRINNSWVDKSMMNGYATIYLEQYKVTTSGNILASLDHPASFTIEKKKDMPVLDGTEMCYPIYAAAAKAVYKDIASIETPGERPLEYNGNVVQFTNTSTALNRLNTWKNDIVFSVDVLTDHLSDDYTVTVIGKAPLVFYVGSNNTIDSLTSEQIRRIFGKQITDWKVVGTEENAQIYATALNEKTLSYKVMQKFMMDMPYRADWNYNNYSESLFDKLPKEYVNLFRYKMMDEIIGYTMGFYMDALNSDYYPPFKTIAVDGIEPTVANIKNGTYPCTVNLVMVTRKKEKNTYVQQMIDFMLSEEGQTLIERSGYAPIR